MLANKNITEHKSEAVLEATSKSTLRTTISTKLTVAFVGVSMVGIFIVGLTAKTMLMQGFDSMVASRAQSGFTDEVAYYYRHYGSWEAAQQGERFIDFSRKRRGLPPPPNRNTPDTPRGKDNETRIDRTGVGFFVVDEDSLVLIELGRYKVGESVHASIMETASPILIDGAKVGYVVYDSRPELSRAEKVYLQSLNNSLFLAFIAAILTSIPLGIYLASRLSMPIRELTSAAKAISNGDFSHVIEIRTNDELGQLSESFNKMSADLETSQKQLIEYSEELFELSRRDELTGLFNRRAFDESINQLYATAIRYEQSLSIAVIDIDHFKNINDENSHQFGDLVLKTISKILTDNIRDVDIAARYGGDEFVIAYPYTSEENALIISERLRASINAMKNWDDKHPNTKVTVSIGISGVRFGKSVDDMMNKADESLYRAKSDGRNCVCS